MNLADFRLGRDRTQEPLLHAGSGLFGARWMGGHCQAVLGDVCCFLFSPNQSPTVSLPVIFHVSRGAAKSNSDLRITRGGRSERIRYQIETERRFLLPLSSATLLPSSL